MMSAPESVTSYLDELGHTSAVDGFLCLSDSETIIRAHGQVGEYNLEILDKEKSIVLSMPFLEGLLPPSVSTTTVISHAQIDNNQYFDIHLFIDKHGYWVLFIDTTLSAIQLQEKQQARLDVDFDNDKRKGSS